MRNDLSIYETGADLWWSDGHLELGLCQKTGQGMDKKAKGQATPCALDPATVSEIVEMALSDHTSFAQIRFLHGLSPDQVKTLMRTTLSSGSYRAWRRRVRQFGDRRAIYK